MTLVNVLLLGVVFEGGVEVERFRIRILVFGSSRFAMIPLFPALWYIIALNLFDESWENNIRTLDDAN